MENKNSLQPSGNEDLVTLMEMESGLKKILGWVHGLRNGETEVDQERVLEELEAVKAACISLRVGTDKCCPSAKKDEIIEPYLRWMKEPEEAAAVSESGKPTLYVRDRYNGSYFTLRESEEAKGNCAWINFSHRTLDIRRKALGSTGLQRDLWNDICAVAGGEKNVLDHLPEGVLSVPLQGSTQHNGGSGFNVGFKGFPGTKADRGKSILQWLSSYCILKATPGNTYWTEEALSALGNPDTHSPKSALNASAKRPLFIHNRDASGDCHAHALTLKWGPIYGRLNIGAICLADKKKDTVYRHAPPYYLDVKDELMDALLDAESHTDHLTSRTSEDSKPATDPAAQGFTWVDASHCWGGTYNFRKGFGKLSDAIEYLQDYFDVRLAETNLPGLSTPEDLKDIDNYESKDIEMTAFGRALLDGLCFDNVSFKMYEPPENPFPITVPVQSFIQVSEEERSFLKTLNLPPKATILDLGCGLGRHLKILREYYPEARLVGVDYCPALAHHCRTQIAGPTEIYESLAEIPNLKYDLILMLGNGMGILAGNTGKRDAVGRTRAPEIDPTTRKKEARLKEALVRERLNHYVNQLAQNGRIFLQTGVWKGHGFETLRLQFAYGKRHQKTRKNDPDPAFQDPSFGTEEQRGAPPETRDPAFWWSGASKEWLNDFCNENNLCFAVQKHIPSPFTLYFHATISR
jgi:SAM-dependent methyltransferase